MSSHCLFFSLKLFIMSPSLNCFMIFFISQIIIIHQINAVYKLFQCYLFSLTKKEQTIKGKHLKITVASVVNVVRFNITAGVEFFLLCPKILWYASASESEWGDKKILLEKRLPFCFTGVMTWSLGACCVTPTRWWGVQNFHMVVVWPIQSLRTGTPH